jgi:serine/threonine protein kinase/Tfp pilus assembly protein PilF
MQVDGEHEHCPSCGLTMAQTDFTQLSDVTLPGNAASGAEEKPLEKGRVLGDRYEILDVVGKGGMGWVYKARDREIDRLIALKVIRRDLAGDETVIRRFRDEIILARKVTHKNVLRIYDIAEVEGVKFISMPYIEGKDLKTLIQEHGPLGTDETVRIARQVAEALKSAHEAGVIHRDLKPQNILIDPDGTAYVSDFGIAKSAEKGGMTVTGQIIGTPEYMSPEQAEGKDVDYRTDIYSFGLVVYEMLTGEVPFKADSIITTLMKRLREQPQLPSILNPSVPQWLDRLTSRALERNLEDRYASIEQVLADIDSQTVRIKKRLRPRTLGILAGVAGVAIVALLVFALKPTLVFHKARTYLAILPFQNVTKDASLDWLVSGIPDNLTADLAQSKYFRIMSAERLAQVVGEMGRDMADLTSGESIRLLARASNLDAVALGSFIKAGDEVRITLTVENAHTHEIIGSEVVKGSEEDLLAMIDQLTRVTKQIFKLSRRAIDADLDTDVAMQRTKSVRAASEFARGLDLARKGSNLEAAQAFESAIEADPDFAMAYGKAAETYKNLGYDDKAEKLSFTAVEKVVKFMDRVPPADRTFIMANNADITNNAEEAIRSYKDFIAAYPDDPEGYYKLGLAYDARSEWDAAAENIEKAIRLDPKFASARFKLGIVRINQGKLDEALGEMEQALQLYKDLGNREGEANVLNAIGVVHNRRSEFEKAIEYYQRSIDIKQELGDKRGIAASLGNLGLVYELMGRRDQALEVLERSLEIKREIGDKRGISTALNKIGLIYQSQGRFEEALANYERSYETRKEIGSKDLMASSLSDMGTVYSMMGRYDKAIEMDSLALALRMETGDARDEVLSLLNICLTLIYRGDFSQARARLDQGAAIVAGLDDERLRARCDQTRGIFYVLRGQADSSVVALSSAFATQQSIEEKPAAATTAIWLGEAFHAKADYVQALRNFDAAIAYAKESGDQELGAAAAEGKAETFMEIGHFAGVDSLSRWIDTFDRRSLSHQLRCRLQLLDARRLHLPGKCAEALASCDEVVSSIGHNDVRCRATAMMLSGQAKLAAGYPAEALSATEAVVAETQQYKLGDLRVAALTQMGDLLYGEHRAGDALAAYQQALDIADRLGIGDVVQLLGCGEASVAAGHSPQAAAYYERALERAAAIVEQSCPRRLKQVYVSHLDLARYVSEYERLAPPEALSASRRYRDRFGLK